MTQAYRDPRLLRELYHDEELSTTEIADLFDVSRMTITYWMDKHDIERRRKGDPNPYATFFTTSAEYGNPSYEVWASYCGDSPTRVPHHRLLAVAIYGFDAVANTEIHHRNGIPWDNRPTNLIPLDPTVHAIIHKSNDINEIGGVA